MTRSPAPVAALPAAGVALASPPKVPPPVGAVAYETAAYNPADPSTHFVHPAPAGAMSPSLAAMLGKTLIVAATAEPSGPAGFQEAVHADLQAIYETPTGKLMLDSIHAAGRPIYINYWKENRAGFPPVELEGYFPRAAFCDERDNITPGPGVTMVIGCNPFQEKVGRKAWNKRPPAIGLAHELVHVEQAGHGRMLPGISENPRGSDTSSPEEIWTFELDAVGVPPYDVYPVSENKIRAEWNPPQPRRPHY